MSPDDIRNLSDALFWASLISGGVGGFLAVFAVGMISKFVKSLGSHGDYGDQTEGS